MLVLALLGVAHATETDCVTKDLTWRWLNTTEGAKAGDRWVHGSKVVVEQAAGASGRVTWKVDEASKVPFRTSNAGGNTVETFKWNVTLTATDGKALGGDVTDAEVKLTLHCQKTTPGAAPAAPAPAPKAEAPKKP